MALPSFQSRSRRFADGGAMPPPQAGPQGAPGGDPAQGGGAPPQGGAPDPGQQLQAAVQQYAQSKDPQLAVQIADMLVQLMGAGGGDPSQGGGDPSMQGAAGGGASGGPPQMNRKGGKMPAFGSKGKAGDKPAFAVPGKDKANDHDADNKSKPMAKSGKPMDAFQKIRAAKEAKQMKAMKR